MARSSTKSRAITYWLVLLSAICGLVSVFLGFIEHAWVTYAWIVLAVLSVVQIVRLRRASAVEGDEPPSVDD